MARIRTIKPEFFTSSDIVKMTPLARLFYVSLWCESDREGRLKWDLDTFKLRYFPGDNCDLETLAEELTSRELIILYEIDGKDYAEIPTFKDHQVINNREAESVIPARVKVACTRDSGEGKEGREGKGKERKTRDAFDASQIELDPLINKTSWLEWVAFRKHRKAITEEAAKKQLKMLVGYDQATQARIIDKSISGDYQGLFAPEGQAPPITIVGSNDGKRKPLTA